MNRPGNQVTVSASNNDPVPVGSLKPCAVCGSSANHQTSEFIKAGLSYTRCPTCRLVMINPRPTSGWIDSRYAWLAQEYFMLPDKISSDFSLTRFVLEFPLLEGLSGDLLDVGCNDGPFVKQANDRGFNASGIDIMKKAVDYGREHHGLDLRCGDFTAGQLDAESFDIVTMWATLEHLEEPAAFVREAWRVLRPGGYLAVSVPNYGSLVQRLLGQKDRYVGVEHLNYFEPSTLVYLLSSNGFIPAQPQTRGINPIVLVRDALHGSVTAHNDPSELLENQLTTEKVKTATSWALARSAHRVAESLVSRLGLGTLLLLRGRKPMI